MPRTWPGGVIPASNAMFIKFPPSALPMAPVWPAAFALWGPGGRSALHAHHALHLMLCRTGLLTVSTPDWRRPRRCAGVLTAPDASHAVDARGRELLLMFVDPETPVGAALGALAPRGVRTFSTCEREHWLGALPREGVWEANAVARQMETVLAGLGVPPRRRAHPRVQRLLRRLRGGPLPEDTGLEALAKLAGLSPSRLMHVFTASTGVPLRVYLLWLRLQRAARALSAGLNATAAAQAAGFADSAHLTRTFRRMFGITPSALRQGSQFVQAAALPDAAS